MSVKIREDDFIRSVADALQHISYYHPRDYIRALGEAYRREESPSARSRCQTPVETESPSR